MKNLIVSICTVFVLISLNVRSQSLKVDYQEVLTMKMQLNQNGVITSKTLSTSKKDSQLSYKDGISLYESTSEAKTETPSENSWLKMDMTIYNTKIYKDRNLNKLIAEDYILDKKFLIVDTLVNYNWQITDKVDTIIGKKCYKAIIQMGLDTVAAWFCPEIPISDGPFQYDGLPGLILKLEDRNNVTTATQIQMGLDTQMNISKPQDGKIITQKDFDELKTKKMKQLDMPTDGTTSVKVKILN